MAQQAQAKASTITAWKGLHWIKGSLAKDVCPIKKLYKSMSESGHIALSDTLEYAEETNIVRTICSYTVRGVSKPIVFVFLEDK